MSGSQLLLLGGTPQVVSDPNFEYTTLLLPGNGTNGAQNNTFLDSSTNAFSITRNGNTTQGTFSPFSQTGWGNYFDGTGDYLTAPSGASPSGTGTFTVEFWIYPLPIASGYRVIFANGTGGGFAVLIQSAGTISYGRALVAVDGTTTGAVSFNQWNHVALVRSGTGSNQFVVYINGTSAGTFTNSTNYSAGTAYIGIDGNGIDFPVNAYLSNVRVTNTAVYTSNFTPPTSPLTAITNTSLLTCQSNRFIDNSTNAFAITRNGDVSVQAFSPFNPTAAWSAATNGGSGYFDGSGDYLTVASNAAFGYGTGNFTIEMWIYPTVIQGASTPNIFDQRTANPQVVPTIYLNNGQLIYYVNGLNRITGATLVAGQWYHIAVCRASGSTRMFLNGTQTGSTYADANNYITSPITIFTQGPAAAIYQEGYCSNLRVVKGTALYTTTFTPPTSPLTAISGTSLLLNYTNAGIYDATSKNDLETVGNAQISTTQSKFGGSSMYFDGTGDYLTSLANPLCRLMDGNFTVEMWVRLAASQSNVGLVSSFATNNGWVVRLDTTTVVFAYGTGGASTVISNSASLSTGVWYHIAWTKSGTTLRSFVDGTQVGANHTVSSAVDTTNTGLQVGRTHTVTNDLNGFINDLRITKGVARYTANFTAPTAAFPLL